MYTYPEALNAFHRIAMDLFRRAHDMDPVRFPWAPSDIELTVVADSVTGTASVDWDKRPSYYGSGFHKLVVKINMPVKPATYRMTETEFQHWVAYLLHEVGHPFHTDREVWMAAVRSRRQVMLNYLEDVREEKATIDMGLAVNARLMFSALIDSLHAKNVADGYDPNDMRSLGWTLALLGRTANGYDVDISDVDRRLNTKGHVGKILKWALPELAKCQSTQDCLDLADKVTAAARTIMPTEQDIQDLQDMFTNPNGESDDDSNEGGESATDAPDGEANAGGSEQADEVGGEGPDSDASAETEAEGSEEDVDYAPQGVESSPEAEGEPAAGDGAKQKRTSNEEEPEPQPEPEEPQPDSDDMFDQKDMTPNKTDSLTSSEGNKYHTTRQVLGQVREALSKTPNEKPIVGRTSPIRDGHGFVIGMTADVVAANASKMGRQRALLAGALKKEDSDDWEGGRLSGRFDRRAVSKLTTGNPHIFGRRTLSEGYATDVQVLVDGSSSMENARILAAATLALVVAQACAQVGVDCTAHVFNDHGLHTLTKGRTKPVGRKFAYAYNQTLGYTPLTENMLAVAFQQQRRAPHRRRIMFLITDGGCDLGPEVLKAAGQYVEEHIGAEIANLHIGYKTMGLFRNEVAVNVHSVSTVGLQSLTKVLERGL